MLEAPRAPYAEEDLGLLDVLALDDLGGNRFASRVTYDNNWRLYGGQVCAQALMAAGATVDPARHPHSLHAYFLRMGTPAHPVEIAVEVDRDGRSFSARRIAVRQRGELILTMSMSFALPDTRAVDDDHVLVFPEVEPPAAAGRPLVLVDFEQSIPSQTHPLHSYPTRHWLRCTADLPTSPLVDAAVITYLSDLCTGHDALASSGDRAQATLDHAVWFHRPATPRDWLLIDLRSRGVSSGRGLYTGDIWDTSGTLVASLAQETLYREKR
ncbi:MAG: Choloyl-CoA hydrolase [Frankiales bacterium]|nr:Choloyl-CoA hydrolase [Frankiales bacterium]